MINFKLDIIHFLSVQYPLHQTTRCASTKPSLLVPDIEVYKNKCWD